MVRLYNRNWSQQDLIRYVGHLDQVAGIKSLEGADGVERGLEFYRSGQAADFPLMFWPTVPWISPPVNFQKGMSLTWRSPVGDAHPAYYDAGGAAWLRTFQGGMVVTCGLDTFGPANQDEGEDLGQHGRASSLPARNVIYRSFWKDEAYYLEVSGEMRQTRVYGENLVLQRHILTSLGSNKIRIEDVVKNEGFKSHPHLILYDINVGFPLLSESTRLKFDVADTAPWDELAQQEKDEWKVFQAPTPEYQERDYTHTPLANAQGWASVEVENPDLKLGLRLSFDQKTLPYLAEWKMMGEGLYVLAIQPMNTKVWGGRAEVRKQGVLPYLEAGESRRYAMEIEVIEHS